jgi:hypothetical protein
MDTKLPMKLAKRFPLLSRFDGQMKPTEQEWLKASQDAHKMRNIIRNCLNPRWEKRMVCISMDYPRDHISIGNHGGE